LYQTVLCFSLGDVTCGSCTSSKAQQKQWFSIFLLVLAIAGASSRSCSRVQMPETSCLLIFCRALAEQLIGRSQQSAVQQQQQSGPQQHKLAAAAAFLWEGVAALLGLEMMSFSCAVCNVVSVSAAGSHFRF